MKSKTVVLFVRGLPGSGKTTLSTYISKEYKFAHINPDFFASIDSKSDREERLRKFDLCVEKVKELLSRNISVVWDQPWRKSYNIEKIVTSLNKEFKFTPLIVELQISTKISWERTRDKFMDKKSFDEFSSKYLELSSNFPTLILNANNKFEINSQKVKEFLEYNITHG